jgi:hypothetical protein
VKTIEEWKKELEEVEKDNDYAYEVAHKAIQTIISQDEEIKRLSLLIEAYKLMEEGLADKILILKKQMEERTMKNMFEDECSEEESETAQSNDNNTSTMNIYAKKGDKVIYCFPTSGYDYDKEQAKEKLVLNQVYTIERTKVHGWSTDVYLQEVQGSFNSVMFADFKESEEQG